MIYLVAHVVRATTTQDVEFEIASPRGDKWFTNDGYQIWPFWHMTITEPTFLTIPEGWIDHLHELARQIACQRKTDAEILEELDL
jgi:hypothetical protein